MMLCSRWKMYILCLYPHNTLNIVLLFFLLCYDTSCVQNERCKMEETCNGLDNQGVQAYSCATKKSRWLTVVYRDLDEDEVRELINHKNCSA
jgi:hypothetical protein